MTKIIYSPQNRAREFSPYALNVYLQCNFKCLYCYNARFPRSDSYFGTPTPRPNLIPSLEKQLSKEIINAQTLISFMGDPYNSEERTHRMTRQVLEILFAHKIPVAILTKGGTNCLDDMDLFKRFNGQIKVGASLTFIEEKDSLKWEPGAALPTNRFEALKELHQEGIKTWASLEPVVEPQQTLRIIQETHFYVDQYKVGKINHSPELERAVDWDKFLFEAVGLLRSLGKPFYVKKSLQVINRSTQLTPEEIDQDFLCVR
jgi:DNA repair photolyase